MARRASAIGWSSKLLTIPLASAFAAALGCASPTLPLPPPELPTQSAGIDADHITLSTFCGGVEPNAIIVIVNENQMLRGDQAVSGAIANDCGRWDASVFAHTGDLLQLTQLAGGATSPTTLVRVR